jgi:ferrous iron transport protein B
VLADATNLARNLVIVGELLARDEAVVVALNMVDLAKRRGITIDAARLSARIGVPVVPMVASKGQGLDAVRAAIENAIAAPRGRVHPADLPGQDLTIVTALEHSSKEAAALL